MVGFYFIVYFVTLCFETGLLYVALSGLELPM